MGKKILVAESDNAVQQVVSYFLNLEGFEVTTVGDGVAALDAIEQSSPGVILLDPGLAGINGIEVSRLLGENPQFKNIPVLFLAGLNRSSDIPPGYGIIHKPIDPTKMVNIIKEYIEKAQQTGPALSESAMQDESVSIEELLGWEVSEEAPKEEVKMGEGSQGVMDISSELFGTNETQPSSGIKEMATQAPGREAPGRLEGVEADLRGRITEDMIENIVSRISRDIVERVVGEIVPKIAEEEIKKEIERLKGEGG